MTTQPPINKKKCNFWRGHNWGKWQITYEGAITRSDHSMVGGSVMQKRECLDCGFTQISAQKVSLV